MKLAVGALFFGVFLSSSCFQDDPGPSRDGYHGSFCEQFTSCGTCTPVLGCGWCQAGDKGICASDPDQCAPVASFSWTWERAFCPAEATPDAGAATDTPPADGSVTDAKDASNERGADAD